MEVKLRTVGNHVAATIPQSILEQTNLKEGDTVEFMVSGEQIIIKKKKLAGERYLESLYGKPIEEIEKFDTEIVDTGIPVGNEVW